MPSSARREGMTAPLPPSRRPRQQRYGHWPSSARREGMTAPLPASRRPRQQRYGNRRESVDWSVLVVFISGMVVVVAFWTVVGLGITALL